MKPTQDHLTLLARASWRESGVEFGAPEIDSKRPYGNSDVEGDLEELLPHLDAAARVQVHRELSSVLRWLSANAAELMSGGKPTPTPEQVLATPMGANDANAATIRDYLVALLRTVWAEGEGFSGKRPFGNSDWDCDLIAALAHAGHIESPFDEDEDWISGYDERPARKLIDAAIEALGAAS